MRFPITAAKFEKVSYGRFADDCNADNADNILDGIKMPARATSGSAGYDFFAPYDIVIKKGESIVVPTGMRCRIADGFFLCILPRSGQGFKYALSLSNTAGIK
ncbi:MAG: deoxyuridine 5'-triphosphate nucleotidohydrolase, partial [Clostridia bacterium]|nr:deoxyuridine 5'-triphosphate nucleotidohydrolase [Clostridia bacterium]